MRRLVGNSHTAIDDGTYDIKCDLEYRRSDCDLTVEMMAQRRARHPILITEIKFASPSEGKLRTLSDPAVVASKMVKGGASALSVLTQPHLFGGSPEYFARVREEIGVPMLMKDIVVDRCQVDAARRLGADYILLIESIFGAGHADDRDGFIEYAHNNGLGVLLEVHTAQEYTEASSTDADIIGINNRNLDTLEVDIGTTCRILSELSAAGTDDGRKPTVSESGIYAAQDILRLHGCGADAFLIGSSIMKNHDIEGTVRGFVKAY